MNFPELDKCLIRPEEMENDGLIVIYRSNDEEYLPDHARPFVRNVWMDFDLRIKKNKPDTRNFSMTI